MFALESTGPRNFYCSLRMPFAEQSVSQQFVWIAQASWTTVLVPRGTICYTFIVTYRMPCAIHTLCIYKYRGVLHHIFSCKTWVRFEYHWLHILHVTCHSCQFLGGDAEIDSLDMLGEGLEGKGKKQRDTGYTNKPEGCTLNCAKSEFGCHMAL